MQKLYRIQSWFWNRYFLVFLSIFDQFWTNFGSQMGEVFEWNLGLEALPTPKWTLKAIRSLIGTSMPFQNRFGTDFEAILAPKMVEKSWKNRCLYSTSFFNWFFIHYPYEDAHHINMEDIIFNVLVNVDAMWVNERGNEWMSKWVCERNVNFIFRSNRCRWHGPQYEVVKLYNCQRFHVLK